MDQSQGEVWAVLLPVLVGGGLALLGSLLGPMLQQWWAGRTETQKLRVERFEQLLATLHAHDHWLELRRLQLAFGREDVKEQAPLHKTRSIAALYFPHLLAELNKLTIQAKRYEVWMAEAQRRRLDGKLSEVNHGFDEAYDGYLTSLHEFQRFAIDYAVKRKGKV